MRKITRVARNGTLRAAVLLTATLLVAGAAYARVAPLDAPPTRLALPGTIVLDANGAVLERDARDGFRIPVPLTQIAPRLLQATISAEDRRFAGHVGVDPLAVARALSTRASQPSGASTITQQLARRLYLPGDARPLLVRKVDEMRIAVMLEARYSKAEILSFYLNDVYYGRGAYGVEAASRVYFGISARNLDLAHAAYLAGLPQRPSEHDSGAALSRQVYVLDRMAEDGWITEPESRAARAQQIDVVPDVGAPAAHQFVSYARAELARVRPDLAQRDGLVIETTLDAGLQAEILRLARVRLEPLADRNVTDAAVVAIQPRTGRIVAMLGSATDGDARYGGDINMAITPRQPGSALKPFVYAAAFERGYTPATALLDVPTTFETNEATYAPLNFDRTFHGVVPLRVALASSLNVPAVRTVDAIGLDAALEMLQRVGLRSLDNATTYGLSLALGGGEVTLLELTNAYASLAAGGELAEPYAVTRVRDSAGRLLYERAPHPTRRVLSAQHAYLLTDILSDRDARIPGFGGQTPFELPFPAAAKSGTSTGFRDVWTLGFVPDLAIGVWAGNADASAMTDVSGVEGAGPIWRDAMLAASLARPTSPFARPDGITEVTVCAPTGLLPGPWCPSPSRERFARGTEPTDVERYYRRGPAGEVLIDPPLEARRWAQDAGLSLASADVTAAPSGADVVRIVTPASGSVIYRAPELATNELVLRASAAPGVTRVAFAIDGAAVGETNGPDGEVAWGLAPGRHVLVVKAWLGERAYATTAAFEVK